MSSLSAETWAILIVACINFFGVILTALTKRDTAIAREDIRKVEIATNSMKDALVAATAKASKAEGKVEQRMETAEAAVAQEGKPNV